MLSPPNYFAYTTDRTKGSFIDHDDKIDETKLSDAFEWTSKQYQKITGGEVYSECTCWYCEAIRESHNSITLFNSAASRGKNNALKLHDDPNVSSDPNKNPHISAHNAVKAQSTTRDKMVMAQMAKLDRDYKRACKRAKKAGKTPPERDQYAYAYAWGYPMFMPYGLYYPYMVDPCVTGGAEGMYANNPSCANMMPYV